MCELRVCVPKCIRVSVFVYVRLPVIRQIAAFLMKPQVKCFKWTFGGKGEWG